LRDITKIDTSSNLFGRTISFPLMIAPSGMQQMVHMDGELGTSRAAARAGVHMCVSTFSNTSLEDVKAAGDTLSRSLEKEQIGGCYALQLYVFQNRKTTEDLVRRADAAGYRAILLTVDTAVLGNRYNMTRNRFKMPSPLTLPNFGTENINLFAEQSGKAVSEPVSDEKVREEVPNDNGEIIFHGYA
jgi:(S)-2-hydroxy-acid oxidase